MVTIGVLALQGSVIEHIGMLNRIQGVQAIEVKTIEELDLISGLILPGGESTTISKLMNIFGLLDPIRQKIIEGMPVWGTCAGMILLAKEIIGEDGMHLGVMDISVRRNAYGSQLDSFTISKVIQEVCNVEIPLVFIRAPWVERTSDKVTVLAQINDKIVAVEQDNMLATSFHPEITNNLCFHEYFAGKAKIFKNIYKTHC